MWAVEKGREGVVTRILELGANIEPVDEDGWSAVMYAARRGNVKMTTQLLTFGANLNHQSSEDGFTALHLACGNELVDMGC